MNRRRLSDLYVRGVELELSDDANVPPVRVWLQKLNEVDRASVVRRANAAKARFLMDADNEESESFHDAYAHVRELGDRDTLVNLVISSEVVRARTRIESQRANDEESWGKDGYLQGLFDAWVGTDESPGLAAAHAEDPNDPEAKRVLAELERFEEEVRKLVNQESDQMRADWEGASFDTLVRRATHRVLEARSEEAFGREYERQVVFYCTRDPDQHSKRYFGTLAEVDDLSDQVRAELTRAYQRLQVDPVEGKGSGATPGSSTSSGPSEEATPSPSGQQAANA